MKFGLYSIIAFLLIEIIGQRPEAIAQKENVFLHPKLFYKKFFPKLKIKPDAYDTLYIKSHPNYLSVSVHVLSPSIKLKITSSPVSSGGTTSFRTNIPDIAGLSVSYRFISAGFAFLLNTGMQANKDYAPSAYRTATIRYTARGNYFQYKYVRFKGLTDVSPATKVSFPYVKRPDIVSKEFQFEGLHNPNWKKYLYTGAFTFSERQLKSYGGFLLKGGVYFTEIKGDSALIAPNKQEYYHNFSQVRIIRSIAFRFSPGVGGNFVFHKRYCVSIAVFPSLDLYFYKYLERPDEKAKGNDALVFGLSPKASFGYQSKRLYAGIRYESEWKNADLRSIHTKTVSTYLGIEFGYRFNTPSIVRKVYKDTMPPGM